MNVKLVRIFGWFGIIAPVLGFTMIFLAINTAPWFSWTRNALSDLGVNGLTATIFNGGLAMTASVMAVFGLGVHELAKGDKLGQSGFTLFISACVFLIGIAAFPETAGRIHFYFSVAFFVALPISNLVISAFLIKTEILGLGLLGISTALVAIFIWTLNWDGVAIPEAVSSAAMGVWSAMMGFWMIRLGTE
ncbi:MAG: DUF998 domain-containing protein [Candidatus Bathyarchaeota archaeon]